MSDREKLPELIDRYNNGELTDDELSVFLEMIKNNPRLRDEVKLDHDLNDILADTDILELRKVIISVQKKHSKGKRPDLYLILLAASLLLLIGIEIHLFMDKTRHNPTDKSIVMTPLKIKVQDYHQQVNKPDLKMETKNHGIAAADQKPELKIADNLIKNPSLENMIGTTRNAGYFKILSPIGDHHFCEKEGITFEWTWNGSNKVELKIIDNKGANIYESGLLSQNKISIPVGAIKPGLYYFKILQKEEIIYFGKFVIE